MLVAVAVIAVLVLVGAMFWGINAFNKKKNAAAMTWPETPGRITVSYVYKDHDRDSDGHRTTKYEPYIHYEYTVDGQTCKGARVAYRNMSFAVMGQAQKIVDAYPVGKDVTVFYDPANPKDAILERIAPKS